MRASLIVASALFLGACAAETGTSPVDSGAPVTTTAVTTTVPAAKNAFVLPDVTARPITQADVLAMLPTGAVGLAASSAPETDSLSNADLLTMSTLDPDDEASDIVRFGRLFGAIGAYPQDDATAHVWIDVLSDSDAAHGYLLDFAGDVVKGRGGTSTPAVGAVRVGEFPMEVGEEAIGLDVTDEDGTRETAVVFRLGRMVVWVSYSRTDDVDSRVALQYLAEDVTDRVISTLTTGSVALPRPEVPAHRFETTVTIDAETARYTVAASGAVSGADMSCSIDVGEPGGAGHETLTSVAGVLWAGTGSSVHLVGGNAADRALLSWCPAWPVDARDAGLDSLAEEGDPTRHDVDGVAALGYRSDRNGLEMALGASLGGSTVEAFSFWLAEGVPWLLDLSVVVSGDAADLVALTGPGFEHLGQVTVIVRHRLTDLEGPIDPIVAPG